jgi:hypothetical protein
MQEVGLLSKSGLRHLPKLFKIWKRLKVIKEDEPQSADAKRLDHLKCMLKGWGELSVEEMDVRIEVCAVWDTVSAIGLPMSRFSYKSPRAPRFYRTVDEKKPGNVKLAIQALALDERRSNFRPMVWEEPTESAIEDGTTPTAGKKPKPPVIQCWFAGNHSDVGGGNKDMTLANICLAWMIGQLKDNIQFDHDNLWAITTSRSWSKPSRSIDPVEKSSDTGKRSCKVVATGPISPELCKISTHCTRLFLLTNLVRSKDSWMSFFQRKLGGSLERKEESSKAGRPHYSVCIFDHLGIADYKSSFPGCEVALSSNSFLLSDLIALLPDVNSPKKNFEGDILGQWTQHILCAHVYIKQSRSSEEEKDLSRTLIYKERLSEKLEPTASYEACVPVVAILSAFHRFSNQLGSAERRQEAIWEDFCQKSVAQTQSHTKWKACRTKIKPSFTFTEESTNEQPPVTELKLDPSPLSPGLTFTRTFKLLMGRPHEMSTEDEAAPASRFIGLFKRHKADDLEGDKIRPCKKCREIWFHEAESQGSGSSVNRTSQSSTTPLNPRHG